MKITNLGNGRIAIDSPYNPDFVRRIKKAGGKWDPANKVWETDERSIETVREIMRVSIHAPVRGATVMLKIPYTSNTFKQIFANLSFMKLLFRDNRGNNVPNH